MSRRMSPAASIRTASAGYKIADWAITQKVSQKKNAQTHIQRSGISGDFLQSVAVCQDFVDQPVFRGGVGRHEIVAIRILADLVDRTAGFFSQDRIEAFAQVKYFTRLDRSEEHTSELQSHSDLVCRLLLEKKKNMFSLHNFK